MLSFPKNPTAQTAAVLLLVASMVAACSRSAPDEIAAANRALADKDSKAALVYLKNAVASDPKNGQARFLLGQQFAAAGDAPSAAVEFKRALELKYPVDELARPLADALLLSGQASQVLLLVAPLPVQDPGVAASLQAAVAWAHLLMQDLPASRQALVRAELSKGATPETRLIRARLADASGQREHAMQLVDELVRDEPNQDNAWAFKGQLHERLPGGSAQALLAYNKALEVNPSKFDALASAVGIHLLNKDYPAARAGLEVMRKVAPKAYMTSLYDGQLQFLDGNYAVARSHFQAALNLAPTLPEGLLASGLNELKLKSFAQAESQLARVVQAQPSNVIARFYLARAYLEQGKPELATNTLAPLVDSASPLPEVLLVAAQARLMQGDPKGADQMFGRAAKLHGNSSSVRLALAMVSEAKGNVDAAIQELEKLSATTDDGEADLQLIGAQIARKDYPAALKAIESLQRKQPISPAADDLRGQVLLKMERNAEARLSFEAALKKGDQYTQSVLNLAALDMAEGQKERAQQRLEAQVKRDPSNPDLHIALATLAQNRGAAPEAILAELNRATRADPRHVKAHLLLIDRYYTAGDLHRALEAARNAVAAIPDNALLYEALARCLMGVGDARQSLAAYVKLTTIAPREPAGYLGQAKLLLSMNDSAAAGKALQQLLAFAPNNLEARRLTVSAALLQKQPERALAASRELQRDAPSNPLGFALEGEVHMGEKRWDQAATAFRSAMAKPGGELFLARLSQALVAAGKADEARRTVAESVKKQPGNVQMLRQLAATAYNAGDRAQARAFYEQALVVAPEDVAMLNNLAWILVEAKDPNALAIARRAAALSPNVPEVLDTLAQAFALNNDYSNATAALRRAVQLSPSPAPLRLSLARMHLAANNRSAARAELETLRDLGAAFPDQAAVRQLLAQSRQQ